LRGERRRRFSNFLNFRLRFLENVAARRHGAREFYSNSVESASGMFVPNRGG
jgi:hypothetical protein